jgi:hypothetical protein
MLRARECAPIPYLFVVFTFGLVVESIKEFGGASLTFKTNNILGSIDDECTYKHIELHLTNVVGLEETLN